MTHLYDVQQANSGSRRSRSRKSCGDGPRRLLLRRAVKGRQSRATCQAISFASLQLTTTRNYDLAVESRTGPGAVIVRIALRPRRHTGRKLVTVRPGASRLKRRPRPGVCGGRRLLPPLASRLLIGMRYRLQWPPERSHRHCCDRRTMQPRDSLHSCLHGPLLC